MSGGWKSKTLEKVRQTMNESPTVGLKRAASGAPKPQPVVQSREKVLLVAGGTDGIGLSFLKLILDQSPDRYRKIYVIGRNFERLHQGVTFTHSTMVPLQCDITDTKALEDTLAKIQEA